MGESVRKEGLLFLKKKKQKNLCSFGAAAHAGPGHGTRRAKVFWFFFSKKNMLLLPAAVLLAAADMPDAAIFAVHCGICHDQMGTGTMTLGRRVGWDHALLADRTDLTADYIHQAVRAGIGSMPPQTRVDLSDAELTRVIAYLTRPAAARPPHPAGPHGQHHG
jgi:cytochrome c5